MILIVQSNSVRDIHRPRFDHFNFFVFLAPTYQREPLSVNQQDISLGFLTEGLNKLGLDSRNSREYFDLHSSSIQLLVSYDLAPL